MYSENKDSENKTPFSASGLNAWAFKGLIITRLKIRREWKLICTSEIPTTSSKSSADSSLKPIFVLPRIELTFF